MAARSGCVLATRGRDHRVLPRGRALVAVVSLALVGAFILRMSATSLHATLSAALPSPS